MNVYKQEQTKLLLQVEINSSPMRQTVNKAIRGAADLLRFLRNTAKAFNAMTVFVFPKTKHAVCVGKVTVKWEHLRFRYQINWLTGVDEAWRVLENVIMENARAMPTLPSVDELDIEVPLRLSPQDLLDFGEQFGGSATQLNCPHHVMVEFGWDIEVLSWEGCCKSRMKRWVMEQGLFSSLDEHYNSVTFLEAGDGEPPRPSLPVNLKARGTKQPRFLGDSIKVSGAQPTLPMNEGCDAENEEDWGAAIERESLMSHGN